MPSNNPTGENQPPRTDGNTDRNRTQHQGSSKRDNEDQERPSKSGNMGKEGDKTRPGSDPKSDRT